jgi:hypothetical protein
MGYSLEGTEVRTGQGTKNIFLPSVGGEQCAAKPTPPISLSSFSPSSPQTLVHNLCGEGVATERRTTEDRHPEYRRLPNLHEEDLKEVGGALSTLGNVPVFREDPDPISGLLAWPRTWTREKSIPRGLRHKPGGAQLVADTAPVLAKSTAGIEPAGKAERAMAAKLEALILRARQGWART